MSLLTLETSWLYLDKYQVLEKYTLELYLGRHIRDKYYSKS